MFAPERDSAARFIFRSALGFCIEPEARLFVADDQPSAFMLSNAARNAIDVKRGAPIQFDYVHGLAPYVTMISSAAAG